MPAQPPTQDELYREVADTYGAALERLARAYEADAEVRRDLLQDIHIAFWRSFEGFDGRCSLRTWVYRVAHNAATSRVIRSRRQNSRMLSLDELDSIPDENDAEVAADRHKAMQQLLALIQRLRPLDRQIILLYLEGMHAASMGEITGISPGNVATKIHRIKSIIADRFWKGRRHDH